MRQFENNGKTYTFYGLELVWFESVEDSLMGHIKTITHNQFFLDSEYEKAKEIAVRLYKRRKNRLDGIHLLPLDENFDRIKDIEFTIR